jgi:hypothetical protein
MEQNHYFIQFCSTNVTTSNLFTLFFSDFVFKRYWLTQKFEILSPKTKGTSHTSFVSDWEIQVLFNKLQSRINLSALLLTILGYRNKKKLKFLIFRQRRVQTCVFLRKFHPWTNLTALLVTIMGYRNKKGNSEILKFDLLRVPSIQIPTKKYRTLSFVDQIWMHSLLPICGKFTRALQAH